MEANVVQGAFKPRRWWRSKWFALGVGVAVAVIVSVVVIVMVVHHRDERRVAQAQQKSLQTQLTAALFATNSDSTIVQTATSLVNGVKSKRFTISSEQLAQVYLDRANAYNNLGQHTAALSDYQTAVATDGSVKIGALQGELAVQSELGHTSALLPILQQLVPLLHSSQMPLAGSQATQYEADIQAIQSGQEVSF